MNATQTPVTISVCVDCLQLLANGEVTDGHGNDIAAEHGARMQAHIGDTGVTLGGTEEDSAYGEPWFSWAPCEGCGSTVGGDREHATLWVDND